MKREIDDIVNIMKETEQMVKEGRKDEIVPKSVKIVKNKNTKDEAIFIGKLVKLKFKNFKAIITLKLNRSGGEVTFVIDDDKDDVYFE